MRTATCRLVIESLSRPARVDAAALHLSPKGRGRREAAGEGVPGHNSEGEFPSPGALRAADLSLRER
jgi:hypothetical protein